MKVVLIEDDKILSLNFQMMLEELGHDIVGVCSTIQEAKNVLSRHKPDVILSDIMLGNDIVFVLADWFKDIPVVFMTSFMEETLQIEAMKFRHAMFLGKPFHKLTLKSILEKIQPSIPSSQTPDTEGEIEIITKHRQKRNIELSSVLWFETTGNYTTIVTEEKRYSLKVSLKKISETLPSGFIQIHKGFIINIKYINRIDLSHNLVNIRGNHVPVGRSFRKELLEAYNKIT